MPNRLATPRPRLRSGYYHFPVGQANASTSNALGNGTLRVVPWVVHNRLPLSRLFADISAAGDSGAAKFRPCIYADTGGTYPGTLVIDGGQLAADAIAVPEATIDVTIDPGVYWIGGAVQGVTATQPTVRTFTGWHPEVPIGAGTALPAGGTFLIGLSTTGQTGAFPATFPAGAATTSSAPKVGIKVA